MSVSGQDLFQGKLGGCLKSMNIKNDILSKEQVHEVFFMQFPDINHVITL